MKYLIKLRAKGQHHFKMYVGEGENSFQALRSAITDTESVEGYYIGPAPDNEPLGFENSPEPGVPGDLEEE